MIDEGIAQAVSRLSRNVPYIVVEDETGDSGRYYALSDLDSWEDDFSQIRQIDWDVGTRVGSDESPQFLQLDDGDWRIYRDPTTRYLYFPSRTPSSSVTFRVTYTARYTLSGATSTIPRQFEDAVVFLGVSRVARIVQLRVEKSLDPPMGVEFVTMRNKGSGFKSVSDGYEKLYIEEIGGEGVIGASSEREDDLRFQHGEQYMFHHGRLR